MKYKDITGLPKIAIVILNWNGEHFLKQFLPTVIQHSQKEATIVVADNGSTDNSVSCLKENFPAVSLIQLSENYGFAGGYNEALKQVEAEYYILLNSDVEVTSDWIRPLIELMEKDAAVAVCQPKIKHFEQRNFFEYAGAAGGFIDMLGYPFCRGRIFNVTEEDKGQYDDCKEVFWATGACMFIRAELFHQQGGFDADFFAHMEEIDLCWRLKNKGYKIMYSPAATIFHVGGGTLPKQNPKKTYLNFRNNLTLLFKNLPSHKLYFVLPLRMVLDGIAGIKFLFTDSVNDFFAVIKAHFHFYCTIPVHLRKRKEIHTHQQNISAIYKASIVFDFFVKGIRSFCQLDKAKFS